MISTVIPTYNGLHLLKKNLPFVLACLRNKDELIIVDDASTDKTLDWLKKKFLLEEEKNATVDKDRKSLGLYTLQFGTWKQGKKNGNITVVANMKNERFAVSCNRGVKQAKGDYIFLLNNDVSPTKNVLTHLLNQIDENSTFGKNVFAVACHEVEPHKKTESGKNKLWFERGLFIHSKGDDLQTGETAWATGGSALFDKKKWLQLGGFDTRFKPAYWEDIDISYRARKKGWKIVFEEKAIVYHNHESTNKNAFGQEQMEVMSWKNNILFTLTNGSFIQRLQFFLWLPYHLVVTNGKSKGRFVKGLIRLFY